MSGRLEMLADRLELNQLVVAYANAIDAREWDRLDRLFAPDAYIDYRAIGGIEGRYPQVKAWLPEALKHFPAYMHFVGNFTCEISGEHATGSTACLNPMVIPQPSGGSQTMILALWYDDRFVRTANGWRIAQRVERKCCEHNMPDWMKKALKLA